MTSQELYYEFHLILNKNASYENINISKGNFVILYNRELLNWLNNFILKNNSTQNIHKIQGLLSVNTRLQELSRGVKYNTYKLPEDYFDFVDCHSEFEKEGCKLLVTNYLEKPKDIRANLDSYSPSFKFEEGLCNISDQKVIVFLEDFKINSTYLSYYQKPDKIDLEGWIHYDGTPSVNIDSNLDEKHQSEVLNRVVTEVMRQFENGNGYKLSVDREVM